MYQSKINSSIASRPNFSARCDSCNQGCHGCTNACTANCFLTCATGDGYNAVPEKNK